MTAEDLAAPDGISSYVQHRVYLLDAASSNTDSIVIQLGANTNQSLEFKRSNVHTSNLGINTADIVNQAEQAISKIDHAIEVVSGERSRYGAIQNRLGHALIVTQISAENLTTAEYRIRDTDMAKEMMTFTK